MIKRVFLCLWVSGLVSVQGFALDWDAAVKKTCHNFGIAFVKQALSDPLKVTNMFFLLPSISLKEGQQEEDTGTVYAGTCRVMIGSEEDRNQHILDMPLNFSTSQEKSQAVHNTSHYNVPMLMIIYDGKYRISPAPGQNPGDLTYYFAVKDYSFVFDIGDQ